MCRRNCEEEEREEPYDNYDEYKDCTNCDGLGYVPDDEGNLNDPCSVCGGIGTVVRKI